MDDEDTAIFNSADTALLRSSPVKINWNPDRGQLDLQFYKDGILLYNQPHAPGDFFELLPGNNVYEVKLWTSGSTAISRWIRTRASDPIPETTPFVVDD